MIRKLQIKAIYNDFLKNVSLTQEQIKLLDMYINRESRAKISMELGMSERTVGNEINKIKKLYEDYYNLQLSKTILLMK